MKKRKRTFSGLILGIGLLVTACGAAETKEPSTETSNPEVVTAANTETESKALSTSEEENTGTLTAAETFGQDEETVEYEGGYYLKSELSDNTLTWLEHYNSMPEEERRKISMVPHDLIRNTDGITMETDVAAGSSRALGETVQAEADLLLTGPPEIIIRDALSSTLEEFKLTSGNSSGHHDERRRPA